MASESSTAAPTASNNYTPAEQAMFNAFLSAMKSTQSSGTTTTSNNDAQRQATEDQKKLRRQSKKGKKDVP